MIRIQLENAAKRFQYEWIFRNLTLEIPANSNLAITGSNGSGKSTFLKAIASLNPLTEGSIKYFLEQKEISGEDIYKHLTISAPYLELPEEFTLLELLQFHFKFKKPVANSSFEQMMEIMYLENHQNKPISQFSSGMKQRLKLGLCFFSDVSLILLDEPASNLDEKGISWYLELVAKYGNNKTILICSNDKREYDFCEQSINIENYKLKQSV
ncbi:ABC-type multidrug transport system, ATPase component [Belliella baltica DSM 15883]|uniref:ABC-type multidrug transport system, ATPase component n=1 Tax=Belliella baltica (strain DSM 15883 / CIP 108006 / LMG 21964 / BA134) TaxID=866536 RepID=I3ZAE0_BELBD|nr:ATP-binding cassette domain-containing protein [Belliella baltica]AFL86208.1 ABC-type multidrug transport system, ATPase component [Belliella baltica DSM 15883]